MGVRENNHSSISRGHETGKVKWEHKMKEKWVAQAHRDKEISCHPRLQVRGQVNRGNKSERGNKKAEMRMRESLSDWHGERGATFSIHTLYLLRWLEDPVATPNSWACKLPIP